MHTTRIMPQYHHIACTKVQCGSETCVVCNKPETFSLFTVDLSSLTSPMGQQSSKYNRSSFGMCKVKIGRISFNLFCLEDPILVEQHTCIMKFVFPDFTEGATASPPGKPGLGFPGLNTTDLFPEALSGSLPSGLNGLAGNSSGRLLLKYAIQYTIVEPVCVVYEDQHYLEIQQDSGSLLVEFMVLKL